jgi:transcriptional regulator with GAF, ATPase, and Fis domain
VLEEKVIRRVGETQTRRVEIRLICATNRDLQQDDRAGTFREDLYYRMNLVATTTHPSANEPPTSNHSPTTS